MEGWREGGPSEHASETLPENGNHSDTPSPGRPGGKIWAQVFLTLTS